MAKHMQFILDNKNKVPSRNESKCFWRKVGGDTVLFSEDGQWLHQLNDVGAEIWNMCNGVFTVREIAEKLQFSTSYAAKLRNKTLGLIKGKMQV